MAGGGPRASLAPRRGSAERAPACVFPRGGIYGGGSRDHLAASGLYGRQLETQRRGLDVGARFPPRLHLGRFQGIRERAHRGSRAPVGLGRGQGSAVDDAGVGDRISAPFASARRLLCASGDRTAFPYQARRQHQLSAGVFVSLGRGHRGRAPPDRSGGRRAHTIPLGTGSGGADLSPAPRGHRQGREAELRDSPLATRGSSGRGPARGPLRRRGSPCGGWSLRRGARSTLSVRGLLPCLVAGPVRRGGLLGRDRGASNSAATV